MSSTTTNRNAVLEMEVPKGLKGVKVAETEIGDVRGAEGFYHYRQYNAVELAAKRTLEDVWYHLWYGNLPNADESAAFTKRVGEARVKAFERLEGFIASIDIPSDTENLLPWMQACISYDAAKNGGQPWLDEDHDALEAQVMDTAAAMAVIVGGLNRRMQGHGLVAPDPSLSHAEDYLRMTGLTDISELQKTAAERYLILTMDHGFNASTFTARVVSSTGANLGSCISAALGSLSGPLHGGAPSHALAMVDEIGSTENAEPYLRNIFETGGRLMGFGHPVYTTDDPRSIMLSDIADEIGGEQVDLAHHVEKTALELLEEYKPGRGLRTNVEFYAALVMRGAGLSDTLFTPTFAVSRVVGWSAHMLEQVKDNRIFRPSSEYVGPEPPVDVPAS